MGQSFGFASELPLGPELALLPVNQREFLANLFDVVDDEELEGSFAGFELESGLLHEGREE